MLKKIIQCGFFLLYNQLAFLYDGVAWGVSLGQWANWRQSALQFLKSGPTLELAYGTGGLFTTMALNGLHPIGVDLSPFMARIAANRLRQRHLPLSIARAEAQILPFPAGHFSNALATFPTNYIFEAETLAEIRRVLAEDGRLIVVMQGRLNGSRWANAFIEWLYRVTGQREIARANALSRFSDAGFYARWQQASFKGAVAHLIVAQKM
jgi:ubiquinone/menaquinone biosynthesis C-methylase UbiE